MAVDTAGRIFPLSPNPGMSVAAALTMPGGQGGYVPTGTPADAGVITPVVSADNMPSATASQHVSNYTPYILGIVALLVVMHFASEHESMGLEPAHTRISVYNFFSVGIMSMFFIFGAKVIMAKYPVPGIAQIVGAS